MAAIATGLDIATAVASITAAVFWMRAARTLPPTAPSDGKPDEGFFYIYRPSEFAEARAQAIANQHAALSSAVAAALLALSTTLKVIA